jgi:23S rRNA pseudouridine1911/1915/1917 synthase
MPSSPPVPEPGPAAAAGVRRVAVPPDRAGERLDRVLAAALGDLSRSRLKALIEGGRVSADGRTVMDPAERVKPGCVYQVIVPLPVPCDPVPQAIALSIVYEDELLLVLDKPPGLVVHPAAGNPDGTLVNALLAHCAGRLSGIGGVVRPGIVHRLDKDTSGLMVVAKTDAAHAALSAQFADRSLSRDYLAVVRGVPHPAGGVIDAPIGRDPLHRKRMAVVARGGRSAVTRYRVLSASGGTAALVECRLETGRTHQIRVHLAARGHPVVGDALYGRAGAGAPRAMRTFPRQALHAARLRFVHPAREETMLFERDPPADMRELIAELELGKKPYT